MTTVTIQDIQAPIAGEMEEFERKFRNYMKSKVPLLDIIMNFIVKRKGKQLRPILVLLTAGVCGGIREATFRGASLIELLHTASLVHDDVVDDSHYRRGFFSVNSLWKNKIAVLVGDYLLSRGLLLSVDNEDFGFLRIISKTMKEMSEGELLQIEKARRLDITEDIYFEIIRQKTATLLSACCSIGASSAEANPEIQQKMELIGEKLGIAFQIRDDLFDYGEDKIGKPRGIDIKEKKMTLPLIFALNNASWLEKRKIINIIKNKSENPEKVKEVITFVKASGGLEYAQKAMLRYFDEAKNMLKDFDDSVYKESLRNLMTFVIERKK